MAQSSNELDKERYIDAIETNSSLLARAARSELRAPVPSCPGWYEATLVGHLGGVQRFWAYQVRNRAQEPLDLPEEELEGVPDLQSWLKDAEAGTPDLDAIPSGLLDWFGASTNRLLEAFRNTDPEATIWHWSGDNRGITHMRNQAMEATVHRWDAQNAQGTTTPVDPDIALDGIEQHFAVQISAARTWNEWTPGTGETYHFHRTDGEGEWLVRFDGDEVSVRREHGKGDLAVRGTVEDIFLWLWGRIPADRLEVHGDRSLLARYRTLVPSG